MESVFEKNRPSKPRVHLMEKWTRLSEKFIRRFESVSDNDCDFAGTYEDDSVDFNSISTCRDINQVEAAFTAWGQEFTYDCNKEKRGTHTKWFDRNIQHVERVATR